MKALKMEAQKLLEKRVFSVRSCWNCNEFHLWMKDDMKVLYNCFVCGNWYFKGINISGIEE